MKISFKLSAKGSIILNTLQGITDKQLKKMSDAQLKEIYLYRSHEGGCNQEKFYPIDHTKYKVQGIGKHEPIRLEHRLTLEVAA